MNEDTIPVLVRARELIAGGFTRGSYATNIEGQDTRYVNDTACMFCTVGAVRRASYEILQYDDPFGPFTVSVEQRILAVAGDPEGNGIISRNDESTQEEVLAWFDKAILEAKAA